MDAEMLRVLLVDDDEDDYIMTRDLLGDFLPGRYQLDYAASYEEGMDKIKLQEHDVCLCDYRLGAKSGLDFLKNAQMFGCQVPIIMLTGQGDLSVDMAAMRAGAEDYLVKGSLDAPTLERAIRYACERTRAEEALRDSEIRFRQLSESSHEGIVIHEKRRILDVNPSLCRMLGYEWSELMGRDPLDFMALESREFIQDNINAGLQSAYEAFAQHKDGHIFPVEIIARPIPYRGRLVRVAALRDISDHKNAEATLKQQLERISLLNRLTRSIAERQDIQSIFLAALSELEEQLPFNFAAVFYFSPTYESLTLIAVGLKGRAIAAAMGLNHGAVIPTSNTCLLPCIEKQTLFFDAKLLGAAPFESRFLAAGVKSLHAIPLIADDRTFAVLLAGRTESSSIPPSEIQFLQVLSEHVSLATRHARLHADLQEAYNQLKERQQALVRQERLAAVGQLAAGVAHDFNNVLTIIQGYTNLLLSNHSHDPAVERALKNIAAGTDRAAKLIGQLMIFSRKQVIHPRLMDLNKVVNTVLEMLSCILEENIVVRSELSSEPCPVEADESMVEQVILNLAVNARDAMPSGGTLIISTSNKEIHPKDLSRHPNARTGRFICMSVADCGCGIDPVTLNQIFEPFYTTKPSGKGTGLGLATVSEIVNKHKGWIEVDSRLGKGSIFKVFLPASESIPQPQPGETEFRISIKGSETILVVEDESNLRRLIKDILTEIGYTVIEASDGPAAIHAYDHFNGKVDMLLTDMIMPGGMNGDGLATALRKKNPDIKVLFVSGYEMNSAMQELLAKRHYPLLSKPFHPRKLATAVRQVLSQTARPDESR